MADAETDQRLSAVTAAVKTAIGESRVWVKSYEVDHFDCAGLAERVKVVVDGDVQGTLTLHGQALRRAQSIMRAFQTSPELERALAEIEALKDRLGRLHMLSDLKGTSHE